MGEAGRTLNSVEITQLHSELLTSYNVTGRSWFIVPDISENGGARKGANTDIGYDSAKDQFYISEHNIANHPPTYNGTIRKYNKQGGYISTVFSSSIIPIQSVCIDKDDGSIWAGGGTDEYGELWILHMDKSGVTDNKTITVNYLPNGIAHSQAYDQIITVTEEVIYKYNISDMSLASTVDATGWSSFMDGVEYDESDDTLWLTSDNPEQVANVNSGNAAIISTFSIGTKGEGLCLDTSDDTLFVCTDAYFHNGTLNGDRVTHYSTTGNALSIYD